MQIISGLGDVVAMTPEKIINMIYYDTSDRNSRYNVRECMNVRDWLMSTNILPAAYSYSRLCGS
jgi:hypothetical protein